MPVLEDTTVAAPSPIARLVGVSHVYGETKALDDVTLEIPSGCIVGFLGPDGGGEVDAVGTAFGGSQDPVRNRHGARRRYGG